MGHEERFPPQRLSAGSWFRKETVAGVGRNGRDAPQADILPMVLIGSLARAMLVRNCRRSSNCQHSYADHHQDNSDHRARDTLGQPRAEMTAEEDTGNRAEQ